MELDIPTTFELNWDDGLADDHDEQYDRVVDTIKDPDSATTEYRIEVLDEDKDIIRTMEMDADWIEERIERGFLQPE